MSNAVLLIPSLLAIVAACLTVQFRYSDPRVNTPGSILFILMGIACSVGMIFLFPNDVGAAVSEQRSDSETLRNTDALITAYTIFYWAGMLLNYLLLPSIELFIRSGGFGFKARVVDATVQTAKLMGMQIAFAGIATIIFCAVANDWETSFLLSAESALISLSNTIGLIQITLLLGYGLVELPRSIWRGSFDKQTLTRQRLLAVREYRCRDDSKTQLALMMDDVYRYQKLADGLSTQEARQLASAALSELVEKDLALFTEEEHRRSKNRAVVTPRDFLVDKLGMARFASRSKVDPLPMAELVWFRGYMGDHVRSFHASEGRVVAAEREAWYLEDVLTSQSEKGQLGGGETIAWWDGRRSAAWGFRWHVSLRPRVARVTAATLLSLTLVVLVVEVDSLANALDRERDLLLDTSFLSPAAIGCFVAVLLAYLGATLAWATAQLEFSRENLVVSDRCTSALALSYYTRTALGIVPSLLFLVLGTLYPTVPLQGRGIGTLTAFFDVYGQRVLVSLIAKNFAIFFPSVLVALVVLQAAGVFQRLLLLVGVKFDSVDPDLIDELELQRGVNRLATRRRQVVQQLASQKRLETLGDSVGGGATMGYARIPVETKADLDGDGALLLDVKAARLPTSGDHGGDRVGDRGDRSCTWGDPARSSRDSLRNPLLVTKSEKRLSHVSITDDDGGIFSFRSSPRPSAETNVSALLVTAATSAASSLALDRRAAEAAEESKAYEPRPETRYDPPAPPAVPPPSAPAVVVKSTAKCRKCGLVLPSDMSAIEAHDESCEGYRAEDRLAVPEMSEPVIIQNAFVCPMCFKQFEEQSALVSHFGKCDGTGDDADDDVERLSVVEGGGGGGGGGGAPGMALKGWLEKHNRVQGWKRRWFEFADTQGQLKYFTFKGPDGFTGQPTASQLTIDGVIDIRFVQGISHKPGELRRFNIDAGSQRQHKLRAASDAEGRFWCEQLLVWKGYYAN